MNYKKIFFLGCTWMNLVVYAQNYHVKEIQIGGYLGERIHTCIEKRVKTQDVHHLVEPFQRKDETKLWQSEFLGKWMLGAIASYEYSHDETLYALIRKGMEEFLQTQTPEGYIGNYTKDAQLTNWDIWGRKYVLLALLSYHKLTGDRRALMAACYSADYLLRQIEEYRVDIARTGYYQGMPSCSILEPIVYLYDATKEARYLQFAKDIVGSVEKKGNAQLITKVIDEVPVAERTPHPKSWWAFENGQKAYEMMSCYIGMMELGRVLNDSFYKEIVERVAEDIRRNEINIAGTGAAFECWYHGKQRQTSPAYHTMETCVTFTYMQLCSRLFQYTGNALYIEELERTVYNALMASMKEDGSQISKYSPLEGHRSPGEEQCGMHMNCCNANGPRGFALIPKIALQAEGNNIRLNLYTPMDAILADGTKKLNLKVETNYPADGGVSVLMDIQRPERLRLILRIPEQAEDVSVLVNDEVQEVSHKGGYVCLDRIWKRNDHVALNFVLKTKVVRNNNMQAVVRGPLVFARDSRFRDGDVDECAVIQCDTCDVISAQVEQNVIGRFPWITLQVPMILGTDLENEANKTVKMIRFCDFASAGNDWVTNERYRVWIPQTLHIMTEPYHKY